MPQDYIEKQILKVTGEQLEGTKRKTLIRK